MFPEVREGFRFSHTRIPRSSRPEAEGFGRLGLLSVLSIAKLSRGQGMTLNHMLAKHRIWWRVAIPLLFGGGGLVAISFAENYGFISDRTKELLRIPAWLLLFTPFLFVARDYSQRRLIPRRRMERACRPIGLATALLGPIRLSRSSTYRCSARKAKIQSVVATALAALMTTGVLLLPLLLCEELLAQSRDHQSLLDNAPALISRGDLNFRYLVANKQYEEWFGRPVSELIGRHVSDVVGIESWNQIKGEYEAMVQSGEPRVFDAYIKHKAPARWMRVYLQPKFAGGKVIGYHAMVLDITETKRAEMEAENERELLRRILAVQERERHAGALDLHDGMIQYCVGAKMLVDACREEEPSAQLARASEYLEKSISEGRRLMTEWRHPVLEESGLEEALRHRAAEVERFSGVAVSTIFEGEFEIPAALQDAVYRIAHEALTNIQRHSGAEHASLTLRQLGEELQLEVCDGGRGFVRTDVSHERFGLIGIEERARLLGGKACIESTPGVGTQINVVLPSDRRKTVLAGAAVVSDATR